MFGWLVTRIRFTITIIPHFRPEWLCSRGHSVHVSLRRPIKTNDALKVKSPERRAAVSAVTDCRSWDIPNLWVCDGSVFPTVGGGQPVADDSGNRVPHRRSHQSYGRTRRTVRTGSDLDPAEERKQASLYSIVVPLLLGGDALFCRYIGALLRRGCSSMVEQKPSKLMTRVRFPSPAPILSSSGPQREISGLS